MIRMSYRHGVGLFEDPVGLLMSVGAPRVSQQQKSVEKWDLFFRKIYFSELVLDSLSNFHQNLLRSSSEHSGKNNVSKVNKFDNVCKNGHGAISPQHFRGFWPSLVCVITSMT